MQGTYRKGARITGFVIAAAVLFGLRRLLWQAAAPVGLGALWALLALPLMRRLERRLPSGLAAGLSILGLAAVLLGLLLMLVPPLVAQTRALGQWLPSLWAAAQQRIAGVQRWLANSGLPIGADVEHSLLSRAQEGISAAAPALMGWMGGMAGSVGQWMLSMAFTFYFLRDRRRIGQWLLLLLPVGARSLSIQMLREMRRETAGYLRGQLLLCAAVGGLTAVGLLFCGSPAWLLLGAVMGVLELIPYVGPFVGAALVAFFALPQGFTSMLWALGVVLVVQQAESSVLSPKLLSSATRLHPLAVILCVMLGGAAAGVMGILFSVPLLLCLRAALRVLGRQCAHLV